MRGFLCGVAVGSGQPESALIPVREFTAKASGLERRSRDLATRDVGRLVSIRFDVNRLGAGMIRCPGEDQCRCAT
jgi:hypothetical protein